MGAQFRAGKQRAQPPPPLVYAIAWEKDEAAGALQWLEAAAAAARLRDPEVIAFVDVLQAYADRTGKRLRNFSTLSSSHDSADHRKESMFAELDGTPRP